jgi:glyoxylase I family protein
MALTCRTAVLGLDIANDLSTKAVSFQSNNPPLDFLSRDGVLFFNAGMNISIEHVGLPAKDSAALAAWYERVLGARHLWDNGEQPPSCLLALGGAWIEIYPAGVSRPDTADNQLAGFRHLALRVPSLEAARAELEQRGVKFTGEPRPAAGGGKILFFEDGEGNLLHFVERPEGFSL